MNPDMRYSAGVIPPPDRAHGDSTGETGTIAQSSPPHGHPDDTLNVSFHHIGLAFGHPTDPWPLLAGALGGRFIASGSGSGYGWTQLQFANGFRVEGIHPEDPASDDPASDDPASDDPASDDPAADDPAADTPSPLSDPERTSTENFVGEFLDRKGAGPHHLTFGVSDLELAVRQLDELGISNRRLTHEHPLPWTEVLISPADASGVLVQLLENPESDSSPPDDSPEGFPERSIDAPVASLGRVVHAVRDLGEALRLFRDGLGGRTVSTGCAVDGNHWVELSWNGPGRLRLLEGAHATIEEFIGHRPGRVRHLFFNFDEPEYVPGAEMVAPGRWVVSSDNILGIRIVLSSSAR